MNNPCGQSVDVDEVISAIRGGAFDRVIEALVDAVATREEMVAAPGPGKTVEFTRGARPARLAGVLATVVERADEGDWIVRIHADWRAGQYAGKEVRVAGALLRVAPMDRVNLLEEANGDW